MELQGVGCEVVQEQRSQVVGVSPLFMKKLSRSLPELGNGKEAQPPTDISANRGHLQRRSKDDTLKEG